MRRRVEEQKSLMRKISQSSESETDVESDVQDIVRTFRKNIDGKRVHVNVPATPFDNVSFHSESNVQRWKYVC